MAVCLGLPAAAARGQSAAELRWGGDAEGGAPYVEADPADPSRVVGFDVEVAQLLAAGLGRTPRFVQVGFTSIDASAARGDFDVGLSGIEDSAARRLRLAVTIPYYEFREVLTVRSADAGTYRSLGDLRGRRVATLGATLAYDMLVDAQARDGIVPVTYEDDVHPYSDLVIGRVDAVVLDAILAQRGVRRNAGLTSQPAPLAVGHYVGILAPGSAALRDRMNVVLRDAMRDGRLEAILRRWDVWNEDQPRLYARVLADASPYPVAASSLSASPDAARTVSGPGTLDAARRYLPALLRAALITIALSCLSMALAIAVGGLIASGRVYGAAPLRIALTGYVEIVRGTPLLLQLFVLYFGLAAFIQLPAFVAALLGLGLNYAAYESEIYRGALEAVPPGQLESARTLGFTERQILVLVRAPQAFRLALAPMTNDFVALLKDSSLVSVITVVELTKETSIFAANIGSWVLPGIMCAAIYLAMSLPLARVARRIERGWRHA
ncbi:MAG TPA: ABC transporter substrate-binding protein/permease [Vicinamibacterales bacterium]|nr:ABC transporter substrate-binding protein/permease [Vicinamibacterales bacterium]